MTQAALILYELIRLAFRVMLLVLCGHMLGGARGASRTRQARNRGDEGSWPLLTVQLPIRNELFVVERVIHAACNLDYPRDRFEVQVLDDSDDETCEAVARLVSRYRDEGVSISVLHRESPTGFKAGALNAGLAEAKGEFIAIFDADCVPTPSFARDLLGEFSDPKVGAVQARWAFINRKANLLTRLQGLLFDGVFAVDQHLRCVDNLPSQFNGTNGIWRRECLDDIGQWRGAVITEDLYASFSAILRGWRIVHRRDISVATEIPEDVASFRSQQKRWCAGSMQTARVLWREILRSSISFKSKRIMSMHLGRHWIHPCIFFTCFFSPLTTFFEAPFLFDYGVPANMALMLILLFCMLVYYAAALRKSGEPLSEIWLVPLLLPLIIGMSGAYTQSIIRGVLGGSLTFVRTPKKGQPAELAVPGSRGLYKSRGDAVAWLELGMAALHGYATVQSIHHGFVAYTLFFAMVAVGFGCVAVGSLKPFFVRS